MYMYEEKERNKKERKWFQVSFIEFSNGKIVSQVNVKINMYGAS